VLNKKLLEVMGEPGKAVMSTATVGGSNRANKAADAAVARRLLEGIDLSGARFQVLARAASPRGRGGVNASCKAGVGVRSINKPQGRR
jgi:hypothetical protein